MGVSQPSLARVEASLGSHRHSPVHSLRIDSHHFAGCRCDLTIICLECAVVVEGEDKGVCRVAVVSGNGIETGTDSRDEEPDFLAYEAVNEPELFF